MLNKFIIIKIFILKFIIIILEIIKLNELKDIKIGQGLKFNKKYGWLIFIILFTRIKRWKNWKYVTLNYCYT